MEILLLDFDSLLKVLKVGSDKVSGNDKDVSDEISIGSLNKFDSPWVKACVIQCGRRRIEVGGLKGLSRIVVKLFVMIEGYFELY